MLLELPPGRPPSLGLGSCFLHVQRALIVDDEPEVLRALAQTLSQDGYEVTCAHSLAQGIATLHAREFDIVLTDLYLGPTDLGSKVAEAAQSLRPAPPVHKIVALPSSASTWPVRLLKA